MSLLLALHALAAVVWVGGMFFAHLVLRPSVAPLAPAVRLPLWSRVLGRFFLWVWLSIAVLLVSGFGLIYSFGGLGAVYPYIHVMMTTGLVMVAIFLFLFLLPWQRFRYAVEREDWEQGARSLAHIRVLVTINLVLGLLTMAIGAGGLLSEFF
jgi:uncharacterized membrane protein